MIWGRVLGNFAENIGLVVAESGARPSRKDLRTIIENCFQAEDREAAVHAELVRLGYLEEAKAA